MTWIKDNYKLLITPDTGFNNQYKSDIVCDEIKQSIERHVDDIESIVVTFDFVCGFCGELKENAIDNEGIPGCCQVAIDQYWSSSKESVI